MAHRTGLMLPAVMCSAVGYSGLDALASRNDVLYANLRKAFTFEMLDGAVGPPTLTMAIPMTDAEGATFVCSLPESDTVVEAPEAEAGLTPVSALLAALEGRCDTLNA